MAEISRLASLCSWAGQFESNLVGNPKDRFSRDVAPIIHPCYSLPLLLDGGLVVKMTGALDIDIWS